MFEQSLLLDNAGAKKTGAMAASLTAQTLLVATLIAIPLIYSERLPDVHLSIPLAFAPPPPLPPVERTQTTQTSSAHNTIAHARVYTAPTHVSDLSKIPEVAFDEAPPAFSSNADAGVPGGTGISQVFNQIFQPTIQPKPRVADPPPTPAKPQRVGGDVQAAKLIKKVIPVYPTLARQARVSGTVQLIGVIAKDGTIQQLQVASGHPLLIKAALDAVRQWIYRPTLLNGQTVEVIAPIDVIFTLGQ